jgi:hypothetical protein
MSHDVFISYSSHDKAVADAACVALEAAGIRAWIAPRDIMPGTEWGEAIIEAINHCRVVVLIFSANANDSPQIRREIERAVSKGIPIIPLRIEDIAPARSLEYFIGTVHWLDALTPPLEAHLRRLVESVKALLQIDPTPPRIVPPQGAPSSAPALGHRPGKGMMVLGLLVAVAAVGAGGWWYIAAKPPASAPALSQPPGGTVSSAAIDPALVGTFAHDAVIDDYDWRFVLSVAANGTYHLVITQAEAGTYSGTDGAYRTVGAKTGRVRTGTYRAISSSAIAVTNGAGTTTVFRPARPIPPLDPANPVMLGTWQASTIQNGLTWLLTIQNNPDKTYKFLAKTEDNGNCTFARGQWNTISAITGQSSSGTYQVIDAHDVEITGPAGPAVWHRQ